MAKNSAWAAKWIGVGWGVFTGSHLLLSHPPVRTALVDRLGDENKFHGLYSALALSAFAPTTILYLRYGRGKGVIPGWTQLTQSSLAVRGLGVTTKGLAAVGFGQSLATPNPIMESALSSSSSPSPENSSKPQVDAKGIYRITRHGLFTSLALLGVGNIFLRGFTGDVVYWAGYPLIWAVGCPHQDYRQQAILPKEFFEQTSFLPFQAILEGRNSFSKAWNEFNKPVLITSIVAPLFFL